MRARVARARKARAKTAKAAKAKVAKDGEGAEHDSSLTWHAYRFASSIADGESCARLIQLDYVMRQPSS